MSDALETRHYIGITSMGRLHAKFGPNTPDKFKLPPTEPITMDDGTLLYPVSAEIADEFDGDDHDDEPVCAKCGTAECLEDANSGWYG